MSFTEISTINAKLQRLSENSTHVKFRFVISDPVSKISASEKGYNIDGLVQETPNSSTLAMELRLSWTNP